MSNRVAVVTGGSRGIGRATALALARAGHSIVVASFEIEKNEEVAAEIRAGGGQAWTADLDLASMDSIKSTFAGILKDAGRVEILVNNAGITRDALAMRMKPEDWALVLQINLSGAFFAIQQVLPGMLKQRWGRIVNVASVVGRSGNPGQANYVSSKAGLIGLTKAIAQEVGSRGITCNAVAPGFIETDMTAKLPQEVRDRMMGQIALRRFGQPEDVAAAIAFLASDDAAYITGQVIDVNGGMYM